MDGPRKLGPRNERRGVVNSAGLYQHHADTDRKHGLGAPIIWTPELPFNRPRPVPSQDDEISMVRLEWHVPYVWSPGCTDQWWTNPRLFADSRDWRFACQPQIGIIGLEINMAFGISILTKARHLETINGLYSPGVG